MWNPPLDTFLHAAAALGTRGRSWLACVDLVVWRDPLETVPRRGRLRRVRGLFDPTLRRIELFGCGPTVQDAELVRVLLHEFAHAAGVAREESAVQAADRAIERLGPHVVAALAAALRSAARGRPGLTSDTSHFCCPLSIDV